MLMYCFQFSAPSGCFHKTLMVSHLSIMLPNVCPGPHWGRPDPFAGFRGRIPRRVYKKERRKRKGRIQEEMDRQCEGEGRGWKRR